MNIAGLVLSDDLLFASQITGFAHDRGAKVRIVRDRGKLLELIREHNPKCVFLDLHVADAQGVGLIGELHQLPNRPLLIGFGSHVDVKTLSAARAAGCDLVLPRSAFVLRLSVEIASWLDGKIDATSLS